jgi:hypothetical protein
MNVERTGQAVQMIGGTRWPRIATWTAIAIVLPVAFVMLGTGIADELRANEPDHRGV